MNARRGHLRSSRTWIVLLAAVALAVVGLFQLAPTSQGAAPLPVAGAETDAEAGARELLWRGGDQLCYALQLDSTASLGVAAGGDVQDVHQEIAGKLHVRVFSVDGDSVTLGMQLAPVTYTLAGERVPVRERDLLAPFVARFGREGDARAFRFPPLQERSRLLLEEIVRTFECVVPAGAGQRWECEESHAPGRYRAVYERQADGLHKRKAEYVSTGERTLDGAKTRVVGSSGRFVLATDSSWLQGAVVDDEIISVVGTEAMARAATHATLARESGDLPAALAAAVDVEALLREGRPELSEVESRTPAPPPAPATAADIARFRATLDAYHASAGEDVNLMLALRDLMRQFPDLADLVPDIVRKGQIHDRAMSGLLHVLELAGHEHAQKALAEVLGDVRIPHMNRIRAVIALGGVEQPTAAAVKKLWAAVGDRSSPEATDLAHTALLSVGRLGDVLRAADPARYDREIRGPLLAALQTSPTEEAATIALKAIGNAKDQALAPELTQRLGAPSPAVRAAAAEALGAVAADGALADLTTRLRVEDDGRVRSFLVEGMGKLTTTEQSSFATIDAMVASESNGDARYAMARYLADHLDDYPQGYETLRAMLDKETEPRILKYVGGKIFRIKK